jgi:hypothetical protein
MAILDQFIDPAFAYVFEQGPHQVRSRVDALRYGINCVSLAHLALRALTGHSLPPELLCYEMFRDTGKFKDLSVNDIQEGDLVWFGRRNPAISIDHFVPTFNENGYMTNWSDCGLTHVAIATGEAAVGDPLLLHASPVEGTTVVWPLSRFAEHPKYREIYRVARLMINS